MYNFLYSSHRFFSSFLGTSTNLVTLNMSSSLSEDLIFSTVSEHLFLLFLLLKILSIGNSSSSFETYLLNLFQCGKERKSFPLS